MPNPTTTEEPVFRIRHRSLQAGFLSAVTWIVIAISLGGWQILVDGHVSLSISAWLITLVLIVGAGTWYASESVTITPWQMEIVCQGFWKKSYGSPLDMVFINKQWIVDPTSTVSEVNATFRFDVGAPWETDTEFVYIFFKSAEGKVEELDIRLSLEEHAELEVACQQMAAWHRDAKATLATPDSHA